MGAPPKAGRLEEWGADGLFHQQLTFKNAGINLSTVSQTKSSPQTIESITAVAPCALTTKKGSTDEPGEMFDEFNADLLLTLKFDAEGKWKIVKTHRMSGREVREHL